MVAGGSHLEVKGGSHSGHLEIRGTTGPRPSGLTWMGWEMKGIFVASLTVSA